MRNISTLITILFSTLVFSQESYHAHIENGVVTSVEVVTDNFVNANPERYSGAWIKVGEGSGKRYCGIGYGYSFRGDSILPIDTIYVQGEYFLTNWLHKDKLDIRINQNEVIEPIEIKGQLYMISYQEYIENKALVESRIDLNKCVIRRVLKNELLN